MESGSNPFYTHPHSCCQKAHLRNVFGVQVVVKGTLQPPFGRQTTWKYFGTQAKNETEKRRHTNTKARHYRTHYSRTIAITRGRGCLSKPTTTTINTNPPTPPCHRKCRHGRKHASAFASHLQHSLHRRHRVADPAPTPVPPRPSSKDEREKPLVPPERLAA